MIQADIHGGYITSWKVHNPKTNNDVEILYQGSSLKRTGIPPLFPCWNNSGTALRKHGFARDVVWKMENASNTIISMKLNSSTIHHILNTEYKRDFITTIYAESEHNTLIYEMTIQNTGKVYMEIAPALHPYFSIPHSEKPIITTKGVPGFRAKDFDWDNSPPDNHYPFSKISEINLSGKTIRIEDISPVPVIRYTVIWSQPSSANDFHFVCFEPITCLDGAIQRKEILVKPKETWSMKLKFTAIID